MSTFLNNRFMVMVDLIYILIAFILILIASSLSHLRIKRILYYNINCVQTTKSSSRILFIVIRIRYPDMKNQDIRIRILVSSTA